MQKDYPWPSYSSATYVQGSYVQIIYAFRLVVHSLGGNKGTDLLAMFVILLSPCTCWVSQSFPPVFHKTPELHLVFGCGSLHLFVKLLSEASQSTIMLFSCLKASQSKINSIPWATAMPEYLKACCHPEQPEVWSHQVLSALPASLVPCSHLGQAALTESPETYCHKIFQACQYRK